MNDRKIYDNCSRHYEIWKDLETIDVIKQTLSLNEYIGFLKGNILKYRLRAGKKDDALRDIDKAINYEDELTQVLDDD